MKPDFEMVIFKRGPFFFGPIDPLIAHCDNLIVGGRVLFVFLNHGLWAVKCCESVLLCSSLRYFEISLER